MKKQNNIRRFISFLLCIVMVASFCSVVALAAGPYYGTAPCPCGGTARWYEPGAIPSRQSHIVNGMVCVYTRYVGHQGLVCPTCGALLSEVPVEYEVGHNHPVDKQPGQDVPDIME